MPSSTPAGIFTVRVRRARTRPSPPHSGQGCSMTVPVPVQRGQVRVVMTWPRNERWTCWTSPRPRQVSQVWPGGCPARCRRRRRCCSGPRSRRSARGSTPNAVSARSSSIAEQRVGALPDPAAGAAAAAAAEERVHDVAEAAEPERPTGARPAAGRERTGRRRGRRSGASAGRRAPRRPRSRP